MSNMSYCRFENTYRDFKDCYDNIEHPESLSESEKKYRERLIKLVKEMAEDIMD